jgi:hypothetical protein
MSKNKKKKPVPAKDDIDDTSKINAAAMQQKQSGMSLRSAGGEQQQTKDKEATTQDNKKISQKRAANNTRSRSTPKKKKKKIVEDSSTVLVDGSVNVEEAEGVSACLEQLEGKTSNGVAEDEHLYERIQIDPKAKKNKKWNILIPRKPMKRITSLEKSLVKLGAAYPSPESAARAADMALIAMWGRANAEEYLNFPLGEYKEDECFQRYGVDLTRYMISIIDKGKDMVSSAYSVVAEHNDFSLRQMRRFTQKKEFKERMSEVMDQNPLYTWHTNACGVCLHCRQPWLGKPCVRYKISKEYKYKRSEHVRMAVESLESMAYREASQIARIAGKKKVSHKIIEELETKYPLPQNSHPLHVENMEDTDLDEEGQDQVSLSGISAMTICEQDQEKTSGQILKDLEWLLKPFPAKREREYIKFQTESCYTQMDLQLRQAISRDIEQSLSRQEEASKSSRWTFPIKHSFPTKGGYKQILRTIEQAEREGSDFLFLREDALTWLRPSTYKVNQCTYCRTWHRANLLYCPLMQNLCTIPSEEKVFNCSQCKDTGENCKHCLQNVKLPLTVWTPFLMSVPWVDKISPGMTQLMISMKNLANSAISEFKCPHIAGKLSPDALLALGVLAQIMIDDEIQNQQPFQ